MKHKGERHIPDFSSKKPKTAHPVGPDRSNAAATPHVKPPPQVKPQTTSSKSGRRGQ